MSGFVRGMAVVAGVAIGMTTAAAWAQKSGGTLRVH